MDDFEWLGSYEDFIAHEEARGAAVRVTDAAMEPVLFLDDVVRVEKREAGPDDVVCLQIGRVHVFGYRVGTVLERPNGPDVPLSGTEHVVGVATAVIDRDLLGRRR